MIIKLNAELNKTYLWYGAERDRNDYAANQVAQDENAVKASGGTLSSRVTAKASSAYSNRNRDLIDTYADDKSALKKVKDDDLPAAVRQLQPSERERYVQQTAERRAELQKQINSLAAERATYLAKESKRQADSSNGDTFGGAAVLAIRRQLAKSGFENETEGRRAE